MAYSFSSDRATGKARVEERVQQYSSHMHEYTRPTYNETEVRIDFVNPFFKALGWDVDNDAGLPQHLREVTHEATVLVEEEGLRKSKKPDYSFRIGSENLFYVETKKPSVDITSDNAPAFQLRRYGWSGNLKISVLTNYTDLYIYDCSVRPVETDSLSIALIAHYNYTEYIDKFDEIYDLISKEAVVSGSFAAHFDSIRSAFRHEPFDEYFLQQIKDWRLSIGTDIWRNKPELEEEALNISVQRILNRIIFLRISEDRNFEQYETLKNIHSYEELKHLFIAADQKYDSGLFKILEEDAFSVSDEVLLDIFRDLYYPNNSYEFSVVDPFIIGQIYEMFLAEKLARVADGSVHAVHKPEVVDSQGVVNTPKNITDIIVEQSLSALYEGKSIAETEGLRIADICCGSGNFLLSSYEYIVNYYTSWLIAHEKDDALHDGRLICTPGSDAYRLSFALRRNILLQNIWGVDIDPLAVEVTKFSLFLKLLEDTSSEELDAYARATSDYILPSLEENIKNGNSLVGPSYARFDPGVYERDGALEEVRMFDWETEFGGNGFDAIIGNPPYIRVQNMVRYSPMEYRFYKDHHSGYRTASADLLDKYFLFIERAWTLLNENGVVGYIVPHKFMNIASGAQLRRFLSVTGAVRKIIHFGTQQVFKDRSTYTCILILGKQAVDNFQIVFIKDWARFLFDHQAVFDSYPMDALSDKPWTFIPRQISTQLEAKAEKCVPLSNIVHVFVGLQTSADDIYAIKADSEDQDYVYFHDKNGKERKAEKGILRKSIYDAQLEKYLPIVPNSFLIFPYSVVNGKQTLVEIDCLREMYPCVYDYLCDFKSDLDKRKVNTKRTDRNWYVYGRSQSLNRFICGEHLIWPTLSIGSNYVYDRDVVLFTGGGNGPYYGIEMKADSEESIFYIQAILNHWLMELIVKNSASSFRGDYYSHGKQFVERLPIYKIDFSNDEEKTAHDTIVEKVHLLERLKLRMNNAQSSANKQTLKRAVDEQERELSTIIDTLYGVEGLQVEETDESD